MRLIDANELRDRLQNLSYDDWNQGVSTSWAEAYSKIADMVDEMPTINVEPIKIGHWIEKGKGIAECDVCNRQNLYRQDGVGVCTKYCPSCGARMEW